MELLRDKKEEKIELQKGGKVSKTFVLKIEAS
jgi:hypothetical protein